MIFSENRYPLFGIMLWVRTINTAYRRTGTLWEATRRRAAPRLPDRPQKQQRGERRQPALP
jgi:hypothetical protein